MGDTGWPGGLWGHTKFIAEHFSAIVIDALFFVLWVLVQWVLQHAIHGFQLAGEIDNWVLVTFQILFAVSTLAPLIIQTYTDIAVMFFRAERRFRQERQLR